MGELRVYSDPSVTSYRAPGHPEAPFRVAKSAERLKAAGHPILTPDRRALDEDILLAHENAHLKALEAGDYQDPDTPAYPGIVAIARTSLSGALSAAFCAAEGCPAFSLMRPPGHHAGRNRIAGFCYLNNLAIACLKLLKAQKASHMAILDIDVHHGDGTEDIMLGRTEVRFCSLHQVPLYPGTGLRSKDNCKNIPLPPGSGETAYLKSLEPALEYLLDFKPELLAVSAGFDTYKECPIANLQLDKPSYRRIAKLISETGLKRFAVLEGGYAEALPELIENFLEGFCS